MERVFALQVEFVKQHMQKNPAACGYHIGQEKEKFGVVQNEWEQTLIGKRREM